MKKIRLIAAVNFSDAWWSLLWSGPKIHNERLRHHINIIFLEMIASSKRTHLSNTEGTNCLLWKDTQNLDEDNEFCWWYIKRCIAFLILNEEKMHINSFFLCQRTHELSWGNHSKICCDLLRDTGWKASSSFPQGKKGWEWERDWKARCQNPTKFAITRTRDNWTVWNLTP